jgi:hypothetical protein
VPRVRGPRRQRELRAGQARRGRQDDRPGAHRDDLLAGQRQAEVGVSRATS